MDILKYFSMVDDNFILLFKTRMSAVEFPVAEKAKQTL